MKQFVQKNEYILGLKPIWRKTLLMIMDCFIIVLSLFIVNYFLNDGLYELLILENIIFVSFLLIFSLTFYITTGQYKGITRYINSITLYHLFGRNTLTLLFIIITFKFLNLALPSFAFIFILIILITVLNGLLRILIRDLLLSIQKRRQKCPNVAIYGAGMAGAQLAASLEISGDYSVRSFIDDSKNLWGRSLKGIRINPPKDLDNLKPHIDYVLFAIPSLENSIRKKIIKLISSKGFKVLQIPSLNDIRSGKAKVDDLVPIKIEDLLRRERVHIVSNLLSKRITNSIVCVTGAGGSIGSELCRKIIKLNPKKLVIIDNSEPSLYAIYEELKIIDFNGDIISILDDVTCKKTLEEAFISNAVKVVFHAAAYKHVPLVESNPTSGIRNNVFSTLAICEAARLTGVEQVLFISTDKAVRPTNIMGASKRLSEIIVQAHSKMQDLSSNNDFSNRVNYSMVRFGNVLASSGSVVPLFKKQINNGGPLTLTHPEITRYFMTIEEAAELVLQSASLAKGGDVFLLDMGKPIKILSLAEQMIKLSGLSVRSEKNPEGDIEILCTGLRPGEKLFEELLIDAKSLPTKHPLIYRANEECIDPDQLWPKIKLLKKYLSESNVKESLDILSLLVPGWKRESNIDQ